MTNTRRNLLIALAVLALAAAVALAVWWWNRTYVRADEFVDIPRTGEARTNPLYVLKLALRADGVKAEARQRLQRDRFTLGRRDTVLLYSDPRTLPTTDADALMEWVATGGHLLVRVPAGGAGKDRVPVLSSLGITPSKAAPQCVGLQVAGEDRHVEFCQSRAFTLDGEDPLHAWVNEAGDYVFARMKHGQGVIDVVSGFAFLTNDKLKDVPHIALTRQLLAPNYGNGTVHLIYAADMPSFWSTLLRQSWMVWLPLLIALFAWLWRRALRFGPLLPSPPAERRSLIEHIVASGEHIHRYGYGNVLYEAARNAFLARLRRRDPQAAAQGGEVQATMLAERFGLNANDIRDALSTPDPRDRTAFRQRIALLVRMRNSLRPSNPESSP